MTATGYVAARDALHTLLETGVTGFLTSANVANADHRVLDSGTKYAAVLTRGATEKLPSPAAFASQVYEILVECFVRYTTEAETNENLNLFAEAVKNRIEPNPTLLGAKGIISTGTQITAVDQPEPVFMRGVTAENVIPVFLMSVMHVQIEYRSRITGGEFRS